MTREDPKHTGAGMLNLLECLIVVLEAPDTVIYYIMYQGKGSIPFAIITNTFFLFFITFLHRFFSHRCLTKQLTQLLTQN